MKIMFGKLTDKLVNRSPVKPIGRTQDV